MGLGAFDVLYDDDLKIELLYDRVKTFSRVSDVGRGGIQKSSERAYEVGLPICKTV